jgi:hypothetical protein
MSKNFEPIELAYDSEGMKMWQQDLKEKISHIDKLKEYLSRFIFEVNDYNEFQIDGFSTLERLVKGSYGKDFPSYITFEKLADFIDLDIIDYNQIMNDINSIDIDIDFNLYTATTPDFAIWTISQKQNDAYNLVQYALNSVAKIKSKLDVHIYPLDLVKSLNQVARFDFEKNEVLVNPNFILGIK